MTKKDYILLANAISQAKTSLLYATVNAGETKRSIETIIEILGNELKKDNPRFDYDKFSQACNKVAVFN